MLENKKNKFTKNVDWRLNSPIEYKYDLHLTENIFSSSNPFLSNTAVYKSTKVRLIFIDDGIPKEMVNIIKEYFFTFGQKVKIVLLNCSEKNKNIDLLLSVCQEFEKFNLERKGNPVIAIGGGVLLDVVGFAAAIYRRGIPYIKVPTTLLSLVDTSVAVKTSINIFGRRNRFGAFYPAVAVGISPLFLKSLPKKHLSFGLGEIIKIAIVKSKNLFRLLEENSKELLNYKFYSTDQGLKILELSCHYMLEELEDNLTENNLERIVDFGHTFSPIPEMRSLDDDNVEELAHGEAVFLDVLFTCSLGERLFNNDTSLFNRVLKLGKECMLPTEHPYFSDPDILYESCLDAVRHRAGSLNLPIPTNLEKTRFLKKISWDELEETIVYFKKRVTDQKNERANTNNRD